MANISTRFPTPLMPNNQMATASNQPIPPPPPYSSQPHPSSITSNTSAYPVNMMLHSGMASFGATSFMQQKTGMMPHYFVPETMGGEGMPFPTGHSGSSQAPPIFSGTSGDEMQHHGMASHQQQQLLQQQMMQQHAAMRFPHPGNMPSQQNFSGMQQNRM